MKIKGINLSSYHLSILANFDQQTVLCNHVNRMSKIWEFRAFFLILFQGDATLHEILASFISKIG